MAAEFLLDAQRQMEQAKRRFHEAVAKGDPKADELGLVARRTCLEYEARVAEEVHPSE